MSRQRDYAKERRQRNEKARRDGWTGYDQKARWMPRFAADTAGTCQGLARRIEGHSGPLRPSHEAPRPGSYFSKEVNAIVWGPNGQHLSPLFVRLGRKSDWRARLVRAAAGER